MGRVRTIEISATVGAAGTGSTTTSAIVHGKILAVEVNYPTNTVTVDLDSQEMVSQKIVDLAAANTDAVIYPRTPAQDNTGTDVTYDGTNEIYTPIVVNGRIKLSLASGTATEVVKVAIHYED